MVGRRLMGAQVGGCASRTRPPLRISRRRRRLSCEMPVDLAAVLAETDRAIAALCSTQTHFELVVALRELATEL